LHRLNKNKKLDDIQNLNLKCNFIPRKYLKVSNNPEVEVSGYLEGVKMHEEEVLVEEKIGSTKN